MRNQIGIAHSVGIYLSNNPYSDEDEVKILKQYVPYMMGEIEKVRVMIVCIVFTLQWRYFLKIDDDRL